MDILQYVASPLRSSGQWISFNTLLHSWETVGSGSPLMHRHIAVDRWAMDLLQYTTPLLGSITYCVVWHCALVVLMRVVVFSAESDQQL